MFRRGRKGMALITVVLIAALVFASIAGIAATVVPQYKMIASRSASQRALTAAETGLSQVLFNLRNADFPNSGGTAHPGSTAPAGMDSTFTYLAIGDLTAIAQASPATTFQYNPAYVANADGSETPYVTYQAKITKTSGNPFHPNDLSQANPLRNTVEIYSLGTVYDRENGTVLARKAIWTQCDVAFNLATGTVQGDDSGLKYDIVAGTNIDFIGNSNRVLEGDIYAGGNIGKNNSSDNSSIVLDGSAYATGAIGDGIVPLADPPNSQTGVPSPSGKIETIIGNLGAAYSKKMADAFKAGTAPYDGSVVGYPNTDRSTLIATDKLALDNVFADYLGDPRNFGGKAPDRNGVATFYVDLMSGKIRDDNLTLLSPAALEWLRDLVNPDRKFREKIVCYYQGDVDTQNLDAVGWKLGGGLIISGDLKISSSGVVNLSEEPLVLRVMGNVDLAGGATLNGNIYASGENANKKVGVGRFTLNGYLVTPRDIDVNGTFSCYGSLITRGSIGLNGTTNIKYVNRGLGDIPIPGPVVTTNSLETVAFANTVASSWKEVSYDVFHALQ